MHVVVSFVRDDGILVQRRMLVLAFANNNTNENPQV